MASLAIRIAIIGGGLAGATLANALLQVPQVHVEIYESAPEFSERGAAVILTSIAQKSLRRAIPSAREVLNKAGAVSMNSTRLVIGSGPEAGAVIADMGQSGNPGLVIHRASLLRELLVSIPQELLHTNKKLTAIRSTTECVQISFEDGSTSAFDAVIGADGVFSNVRKYVLGDGAADETASPAGFWDSRILIPYEKAKSRLGAEYFEMDRQYGWMGDGAFIMHDVLEDRKMVQCVISAVETDPPKDRKRLLTREHLSQTLSSWLSGPIAEGVIDLTLDDPEPFGWSQWDHKSTTTYANGRVCIVGDAAHAMTPWQGFGAGMAIEDAMVLRTLFANISSPGEIEGVFKAFDTVRRPRCERIVNSSRETGFIFCGKDEEIELDVDKIREALAPRWECIDAIDYKSHEDEAVGILREKLSFRG
ncbi:FAD/NAD(P)-binding domain-containing protein [Hypoxylon sp. NC1633]|nr:FAD/NAD(P)-binding domain-containing protein [Hypoxylon sp. NC1633]